MRTANKVCAFTGHRPNKLPWRYDETDSRCVELKSVLTEQIGLLAEAGVTQFLSGMAEAVDTWAALSVLGLSEKNPTIKLHCMLPCTTQAEKWSALSRERYRSILERADSVVYVSRDYYKDCMLDRNRFLVEHTAVLLAVYNRAQRNRCDCDLRTEDGSGDHRDRHHYPADLQRRNRVSPVTPLTGIKLTA